jgi:hypothetical protein
VTLAPLAVIVVVLGVAPNLVLDLQNVTLVELNKTVLAAVEGASRVALGR